MGERGLVKAGTACRAPTTARRQSGDWCFRVIAEVVAETGCFVGVGDFVAAAYCRWGLRRNFHWDLLWGRRRRGWRWAGLVSRWWRRLRRSFVVALRRRRLRGGSR